MNPRAWLSLSSETRGNTEKVKRKPLPSGRWGDYTRKGIGMYTEAEEQMPISVMQSDHLSGSLHEGKGHHSSLWYSPYKCNLNVTGFPSWEIKRYFHLPECLNFDAPAVWWKEVQSFRGVPAPIYSCNSSGKSHVDTEHPGLILLPLSKFQAQQHPWGITSSAPFYYQYFATAKPIATVVKPKVSDYRRCLILPPLAKLKLVMVILEKGKCS